MTDTTIAALHDVNAGIHDVLSGYETLEERAEPEIMGIARELDALHTRHAAEIAARLAAHGEDADDGTIRGTVNKVATTLRDWAGSLDADALSFVRRGEEMLLDTYETALEGWDVGSGPQDRQLLMAQAAEIRDRIATLPAA